VFTGDTILGRSYSLFIHYLSLGE